MRNNFSKAKDCFHVIFQDDAGALQHLLFNTLHIILSLASYNESEIVKVFWSQVPLRTTTNSYSEDTENKVSSMETEKYYQCESSI